MNWQSKCRERLQSFADNQFRVWCESKPGKAWKNRKRRISPYRCGFSLPEFHHALIEALNRGDEATAKAIMLQHYIG